jgi:membrane protein YqaA with SNARE-associated domain
MQSPPIAMSGDAPRKDVLVRRVAAAIPLCYNHRFWRRAAGPAAAAVAATGYMDLSNLPHWLQALVGVSGGIGLFVLAFLDSTFLPFPTVNDLLLIALSIQNSERMPYYAAMVTLGSLAGCLVLFSIARKGGEMVFGARAGPHAASVRHWMSRNGFLSVTIASLLPPPAPFKVFVFAAGALGMKRRVFLLALAFARGLRFFGEGYLAVRYGAQAYAYLAGHKLQLAAGSIVLAAALYLMGRWFSQRGRQEA